MIYANNDIFNVNYNTKMDKKQMGKEKWTIKVINTIKKNKLISIVIITFILFSIMNIAMIYKFMEILQKV